MTHRSNKAALLAAIVSLLVPQRNLAEEAPRFEQYPAKSRYRGKPVAPILKTDEEQKNGAIITDGVEKGWGVFDGATGAELQRAGPNFAGHYILINFGCGDSYGNCLGVAIVDAKTGSVFGPPIPESGVQWRPYFEMIVRSLMPHPPSSFHSFRFKSPIAYRLNSRLLIVDICEGSHLEEFHGIVGAVNDGCGDHYYLMGQDGLKFIYRSSP